MKKPKQFKKVVEWDEDLPLVIIVLGVCLYFTGGLFLGVDFFILKWVGFVWSFLFLILLLVCRKVRCVEVKE